MQATTPVVATPPAATPSASAVYEALRAQRDVLGDQLRSLEDKRGGLRRELTQNQAQNPVDRAGLEKRLTELDGRISEVEKQISASDAAVSKAAAVPGSIVEHPRVNPSGVPDEAWILAGMFIVVVLLPLSLAFARRIWRRSSPAPIPALTGVEQRLAAIEQSVESVALEVERIGEGQRFVSQLIGERSDRQRALEAETVRAQR
jgi:hypothetical protein